MATSSTILFGDRELTLVVGDLLSAPTEVIVNPANGGLSHGGGLAGQIVLEGGEEIQQESSEFVLKNGRLESGMATHTSAGRLPYKAIVHAVGPFMGRGLEKEKIHQAVISSLDICAENGWQSIGFPAISTGIFSVPVDTCAKAFVDAINEYWVENHNLSPAKIMVYLTPEHYQPFLDAFGVVSPGDTAISNATQVDEPPKPELDESPGSERTGQVDLNLDDMAALDDDDEINDWFE